MSRSPMLGIGQAVRRLLKPQVELALSRFGYKIQRLPKHGEAQYPADFEAADLSTIETVRPYTMTSPERIYSLRRAVAHVVSAQIPGAIVECGVWKGGSMMVVARTLLEMGVRDRHLYLFDTFEGMTDPTDADVNQFGIAARSSLTDPEGEIWARAPLEGVREAMRSTGYEEAMIHYVKGRVEATIPTQAPGAIALLRLDTDWYESTKHELIHLYPRLAVGGVLVIDDYGFWRGARLATDEFLRETDTKMLLHRIDHTGRIALKT